MVANEPINEESLAAEWGQALEAEGNANPDIIPEDNPAEALLDENQFMQSAKAGTERILTQEEIDSLLGFSLADIRELFDLYDADKSSRSQLQTMLGLVADKRETLQQQLEDIQMVLLELEAAEQRCRLALAQLGA